MPEKPRDLFERGAAAQHGRRGGVTEDMGAVRGRRHSGPGDGIRHQMRDR